jgi:toxin ParE1/3/4
MTASQGFELHPGAASDPTEIWEFIAQDNLEAAMRLREEILETIDRLVTFPHLGHQRADLAFRGLRFQIVREYVIVYAPDERPWLVLAVLHGRRNPRVMAAILRERSK